MNTLILKDGIDLACDLIANGELVAVPTETVYGLSANGLDANAVDRLYAVKGRPETKPISLLVSDMHMAEAFCIDIPDIAYILAEAFWPGPLTIILKKNSNVPDIVTAGGSSIGIRCPNHDVTLSLIKRCALPLATPSANISGMPSPKSSSDVLSYFDGRIPLILDGGRCSVGIESTIIDLTLKTPKILRLGGLSKADIESVLNMEVII